jgi:uncharacterized membrane protein
MYNVALFFHIIGAVLLISGIVLAGVAFEAARRRQGPGEIALLLSLTRAGVALVAVGSLLAGAFGLLLVDLGRWGYGTGWVDSSIVLYLAALALGGVGGQRPKQARLLATRLARDAKPASAELRALLDDRASLAANYASLALMVAIIALMCFKP